MNVQLQKSKRRLIDGYPGQLTETMQLYSLCVIPVLLVVIFNYLPIIGIIIAFKDYRFNLGIFGSEWVGFDNFRIMLKTKDFVTITWNTLSLNFIFIVTGTIAAVLLSIILFEVKSRTFTKAIQTLVITPYFLSWVIASYMVFAFLNSEYGILNKILIGIGMKEVNWYSEPNAWPGILTVANIWKNVGMDSVIYYAALMGIENSLFEAAQVDGASKFRQAKSIIIPSIMPLIVIMTILKIGNIFRADFGMFYQLTRNVGVLYSKTDVIDTYIFRTMRVLGDMGLSSAVGLMQSVIGLVLVICTNYASKKIDKDFGLF